MPNFMLPTISYQPSAKKGFTLIELLVAIAILAIISSIGLVTYSNGQKYARDQRRKNDLNSIKVALSLYYQTNHQYPTFVQSNCDPTNDKTCAIANNWKTSDPSENSFPFWIEGLDSKYINPMPLDPINQNNGYIQPNNEFLYSYKTNNWTGCPAGNGNWYSLKITLENDKDPDTVANKNAAGRPVIWCDGVTALQGDGTYFIYSNTYLVVVTH